MNPQLQTLLEQQFLNKRISVPIPDRDQNGKTIPNWFVQCTGICTFIGSNHIMGWEIQVTVGSTPIPVKHINDIQIVPERKIIRK